MRNKNQTPFRGHAYGGRTFFFVGRAAKPMKELPTLDAREFTPSPVDRPIPQDNPDPAAVKAVEKAFEQLERNK